VEDGLRRLGNFRDLEDLDVMLIGGNGDTCTGGILTSGISWLSLALCVINLSLTLGQIHRR